MTLGSIKFKLYTGIVTASILVACWSYAATCINLSQAKAIERLSKSGWIFARTPDSYVPWVHRVLSYAIPIEYLPMVHSVKAPTNFSNGTLSSSIADLRCIPGLEIIVLNGGSLNTNDVLAIGDLVECAELDLRFCKYDDSTMHLAKSIGQLKLLRKLRLSSNRLHGDFLRAMPVLENLCVCELAGVRLEPADLEHIISFPSMRIIDMSFSAIDVATLSESTLSKVSVSNPSIGCTILRVRNDRFREHFRIGY